MFVLKLSCIQNVLNTAFKKKRKDNTKSDLNLVTKSCVI